MCENQPCSILKGILKIKPLYPKKVLDAPYRWRVIMTETPNTGGKLMKTT
jgi:hypothetical protein